MSITIKSLMQQRRDTAANWTSDNPTLLNGELGYETDTGKWKVGNGSTAWTSLAYTPWGQISYPIVTADIANDAVTGDKLANNIDIAGTLDVTNAATFDNNVTIQGDLTVNGTTTTIDTTTLVVEDKNIEMGAVTTPTDSTADGGGITLKGATDKTLNWVNSTDCWTFNQALDLTAGTAGAPALVFNGDVNSGLFQPGADSLAIATAGAQRVTVDSSGNVGIGTSSPTSKFDVHTTSTSGINFTNVGNTPRLDFFSNNVETAGRIQVNEASGGGVMQFATKTTGGTSTERMRIDSSGNVGIGLSSPDRKLAVGALTDGLLARFIGPTNNLFIDNDRSGIIDINSSGDGDALAFGTEDTERMRIDSSGRLLVGLSGSIDSGSKFQVEGRNSITAIRYSAAVGNAGSKIELSRSASNTIGTTAAVSATDELGEIRFRGATSSSSFNTGAVIAARVESGTISSSSLPTALLFSTTADGASSSAERLRIDSAGRVLVGTTTPGTTAADDLTVSTSGNTGITIRSGTSNSGSLMFADGTSGSASYRAGIDYYHSSDHMAFTTNGGNERMRIDSSGNVGIGTSSPLDGAKLTVASQGLAITGQNGAHSANSLRLGEEGSGLAQFRAYGPDTSTSGSFEFRCSTSNGLGTGEAMRIDSSGRVGIGTSSPSQLLEIHGASNPCVLLKDTTNDVIAYTFADDSVANFGSASNHPVVFRVNNQEKARIDSSGRMGIGTSSATELLSVDGNIWLGNTAGSETLRIWNDSSISRIHASNNQSALTFGVGGHTSTHERMRISSTGQLILGTGGSLPSSSTPGFAVTANAGMCLVLQATSDTGTNFVTQFINPNGVVGSIVTHGSVVIYNTSSDYRIKENVVDIADGITRVKQLQPRRFNFIADDTTIVDGFLAHEAQAVVPEAVTGTKDEVDDDGNPVMQGIDQSKLVPLLTAALKEAIAKIETLEQRLSDAGIA